MAGLKGVEEDSQSGLAVHWCLKDHIPTSDTSGPEGTVPGIDRAEVGLTAEQQALRRAVREFASGEIAPYVDDCERAGRYPVELIQKIGRLGYLGAIVPPE